MTQLTPEQIADGWKPHGGGPCPVGLDDDISIMFRDGEIRVDQCAKTWADADSDLCNFHWGVRPQDDTDIIAYKEQSNG